MEDKEKCRIGSILPQTKCTRNDKKQMTSVGWTHTLALYKSTFTHVTPREFSWEKTVGKTMSEMG